DHAPPAREQVDEGEVGRDAAAAVQIEDRRAVAALEHFELDPGNRDHICGCRFGRLGEDRHRSFRWSRPSPALGVSLRMQPYPMPQRPVKPPRPYGSLNSACALRWQIFSLSTSSMSSVAITFMVSWM